jgi:hypothetical protein
MTSIIIFLSFQLPQCTFPYFSSSCLNIPHCTSNTVIYPVNVSYFKLQVIQVISRSLNVPQDPLLCLSNLNLVQVTPHYLQLLYVDKLNSSNFTSMESDLAYIKLNQGYLNTTDSIYNLKQPNLTLLIQLLYIS